MNRTLWGYRELECYDFSNGFRLERFNELGREGWELVAIYKRGGGFAPPHGDTKLTALVAILKRQVIA